MTTRDRNRCSWQEIAQELTRETDSGRFEKLAEELLQALERNNAELPYPSAKPAKEGGSC